MSFLWSWMLLSLILAPAGVALYFRLLRRRERAAAALGPLGVARSAGGAGPGRRRHTPALFFLAGLILLLLSLARPEAYVNLPRLEGTVILAFDVSNSMAAEDLEPNRLDAAKVAARAFVEQQPSAIRMGVVAFGNGGLVVQPPTDDQPVVLAAIDRLTAQGGTSLGYGIFGSLNAIAGESLAIDPEALEEGESLDIGPFPSSVVLLLTDGENTRNPDPLLIAQLAADAGVRIYPVGLGSPEGVVIEVDGYTVQTQLNEPLLEAIAATTNGEYHQAGSAERLREIYESVDLQLSVGGEKMEITSLLAGAGMLLLLAGGLLSLLWFGRMP